MGEACCVFGLFAGMNVLVACEESQAVCMAFRERGHRAFSADIQECSGGHPEWHIQGDVLPLINGNCVFQTADTHTHTSGAVGFADCFSSVYIHDERRCCSDACKWRNPRRAVQKGNGSQGILHALLQRRLSTNCNRESHADVNCRSSRV